MGPYAYIYTSKLNMLFRFLDDISLVSPIGWVHHSTRINCFPYFPTCRRKIASSNKAVWPSKSHTKDLHKVDWPSHHVKDHRCCSTHFHLSIESIISENSPCKIKVNWVCLGTPNCLFHSKRNTKKRMNLFDKEGLGKRDWSTPPEIPKKITHKPCSWNRFENRPEKSTHQYLCLTYKNNMNLQNYVSWVEKMGERSWMKGKLMYV